MLDTPASAMHGVDSIRIEVGRTIFHVGGSSPLAGEFLEAAFTAAILADSTVVLADRKARRVFVISGDGRTIRLIPTGEGPGEVMFPMAVFRNVRGGFGVLDTQLQRFTVYRFSEGEVHTLESFPLSGYPSAACASDSLMVSAEVIREDASLFSAIRLPGGERRRFGLHVTDGSGLRRRQLSHGPLACAMSHGMVWLAPMTGDLLQFDTLGALLHRFAIPGFEQGLIEEGPGTISVAVVADGRDSSRLVTTMTAITPDVGALQLRSFRRAVDSREPIPGEFHTILFDLASGRFVGMQQDLPRILAATGDLLLVQEGDDEPGVRLAEMRVQSAEP